MGRPQCGIVGGRLPEDQEPVQVGISLEEVHTGSYSPGACIFAPHAVPWPRWIPAWAHSLPLVYSMAFLVGCPGPAQTPYRQSGTYQSFWPSFGVPWAGSHEE